VKEEMGSAVGFEKPRAHPCLTGICEERIPLREGDMVYGGWDDIHAIPLFQTLMPPTEFHERSRGEGVSMGVPLTPPPI
jgi:hypothetical protein